MSNRKLLLAHVRNGHYAHAGEEEAIDLTMKLIKKNPKQKVLDIGCGLGGTADYIEKHGFGTVTSMFKILCKWITAPIYTTLVGTY